MRRFVGVVVGSLLAGSCTRAPTEPETVRWDCADDGACDDRDAAPRLADAPESTEIGAITPDDEAHDRYRHLAHIDRSLVEPPLLFGAAVPP